VPQTSKSAVSQVSKPAGGSAVRRLGSGDTAGLETCGTALEIPAIFLWIASFFAILDSSKTIIDNLN
jgi:hypothetical protein